MSTDQGSYSDFTLSAAADLSAKQYRFITVDSSGNAAVSTRGQLSCGVLQDNPAAATRAARIRPQGITKVVLGGSVTAGQAIVSDANGAAVNASSADNNFMGIALTGGSSGEIVTMLLQPRGLS
jgi:hypothetical protein